MNLSKRITALLFLAVLALLAACSQVSIPETRATDAPISPAATETASIQSLGDLSAGNSYGRVSGVSADGSVVVGFSSSIDGYLWDEEESHEALSGTPTTAYAPSRACSKTPAST